MINKIRSTGIDVLITEIYQFNYYLDNWNQEGYDYSALI